jgi:ribonuclease P protein component
MRQTFHKAERLKSKKVIDRLFMSGLRLKAYPLLLVYGRRKDPAPYTLQAAFSVSRKRFKKAVQRNRIKRLMREAYRKEKTAYQSQNTAQEPSFALMFIYIGNEMPSYEEIHKSVCKLLKDFSRAVE